MKPMKRMTMPLLLIAVAALSVACSKQKNVEPPAELVSFPARLNAERAWSVGLRGGDDVMRLALTPAVGGEVVYLAGPGGDVTAVNAANGRSRWRTDLKMRLSAGPGLGAGLVVVGSPDGDLIALDAASGAERWRAQLGGEVLARPAVGAGRVVVHTIDGRIHALGAADGAVAWTYEQVVPRLSLRGSAPPVIAGDAVLCAFDNGRVAALGLAEGDLLWSATVAPARGRTEIARLVDIDSAVQVSGDDVFVVGYQGRVAMLARGSGQIWWGRDLSSHRGLAVDAQSLYVTLADSEVVSLSRRDGSEQWRQAGMRLRGLSRPAVDGEAIVVGDFEGYLHWLDRQTGELVARAKAGGKRISNAPVTADGLVLVQDDGGSVSAYRTRARR